jgi:hypothetical protein
MSDQREQSDPTEDIRRMEQARINARRADSAQTDSAQADSAQADRERLEKENGQVWDTEELQRDFQVLGFLAPLVIVRRRSNGVRGSLFFQHSPRFYWGFVPDQRGEHHE